MKKNSNLIKAILCSGVLLAPFSLFSAIEFTEVAWTENFQTISAGTSLGSATTPTTKITSSGSGGTVEVADTTYFGSGSTRALKIDRLSSVTTARSVRMEATGPAANLLSPVAYLSFDFYQHVRGGESTGSSATHHLRFAPRVGEGDDSEFIYLVNYRPNLGRLNTGDTTVHVGARDTVRTFHFFFNNTDEAIVYYNPLTEQERTLAASTVEFIATGDTGYTSIALPETYLNQDISGFMFYMNTNLGGEFYADNFKIMTAAIPEPATYAGLLGLGMLIVVGLRRYQSKQRS